MSYVPATHRLSAEAGAVDVVQPEADAGEVLEAEEELSRLAQAILAIVEVEAELEVEAEEVVLPAEVVVVEGLGDWSHIGVHVGSPIVVFLVLAWSIPLQSARPLFGCQKVTNRLLLLNIVLAPERKGRQQAFLLLEIDHQLAKGFAERRLSSSGILMCSRRAPKRRKVI